MKANLFIVVLVLMGLSCRKESSGKVLEFYLLKNFEWEGALCKVKASSAVLEGSPLVRNDDILSYDQDNFAYTLSNTANTRMATLMDGTPLGISVDGEVIYYAVNKPLSSSSTCFSSITTHNLYVDNKFVMALGYPGNYPEIEDQRNNEKIIAVLEEQGKLK